MVLVGKGRDFFKTLWRAGGERPGRGLAYAGYSLDAEGVVRYCIHMLGTEPRTRTWDTGLDPGLESKWCKGFPRALREDNRSEDGRVDVAFFDGRVVAGPGEEPRVHLRTNVPRVGPLFLNDEEPIRFRALSPSSEDSHRPWGEMPP